MSRVDSSVQKVPDRRENRGVTGTQMLETAAQGVLLFGEPPSEEREEIGTLSRGKACSLDDEMGEAMVSTTVESQESSLSVRQDAREEVKTETLGGDDEKYGGLESRLAEQVIQILE
jgi:hypothetical protein